MTRNDIYDYLKSGRDPQALLDTFLKDINDMQKIVDEEAEAKKKAEEAAAAKRAAERENKAKKEEARKAAIAAAQVYYALVYPEFSTENLEEFAKTAVDSVAKSIEMVKKLESGKFSAIFDLFE